MKLSAVLVSAALVACGGDDAVVMDAPIDTIDAPPPACAANAAYVTIGTLANRYRRLGTGRWGAARSMCEADAAHLATINNASEADQLSDPAMPAGLFIGMSDTALEGDWRLLNGDAAPYLPWADGEPNGGRTENVGELGVDGNLNDLSDANDIRPALCECEL